MLRRISIAVLILFAMPVVGCKKSEPKQEAVPEKVAEVPKPAEPVPPKAEPARDTTLPETEVSDGIPTEEDYEDEADKVITADNLETELDKLESEIATN